MKKVEKALLYSRECSVRFKRTLKILKCTFLSSNDLNIEHTLIVKIFFCRKEIFCRHVLGQHHLDRALFIFDGLVGNSDRKRHRYSIPGDITANVLLLPCVSGI